jgi:hypothetical protein
MVLSSIDSDINYIETNNIDKNDLEHEAFVYRARMFNKNIKFVLGKPNFEYINNNIVYFNIYLVNKSLVVSKIGIYETNNTSYTSLLDDDGDVDLSKLQDPLVFSYAKSFIKTKYKLEDDFGSDFDSESDSDEQSGVEDETTGDEATSDDDEESSDEESVERPREAAILDELVIIKEQTKEESQLEISNYEERPESEWINNYMKSNKYAVKDNEGGGDCFFATLRDALKTVKIDITVKAIRAKLADEVDEEVYRRYKEFYDIYYGGLKKSQQKIKQHRQRHAALKKMIGGTIDGPSKLQLIDDAKANFSGLSSESERSKELDELTEEMAFMKDVNSVEDLKKVIKTNVYWADNWSVTTLERLYNVKFIIFSKQHFESGEIENVLQCGEADKKLQKKGIFEPNFYILADYLMGIHYKLITYDKNMNKGAFKFKELPYRVKEIVLEKCMEKCAGPFALIPEFREFANCNNVKVGEVSNKNLETLVEKPNTQPNLYNTSIVIQFYNRSANKKVGEGSGESIIPELKFSNNVVKLNNKKYTDWRKKLDYDFLVTNLVIEGNEWASIKHFMLGSRFSKIPELYEKFMKKGEVGVDIGGAQKMHDSLNSKKAIKSKIISDDEYMKIENSLLEKALYAKFTQNDDLKEILKLTGDALLNFYKPGKDGGAQSAIGLMKVRQLLAK